jgi:hypothetical protein
MKQKDLGHYRRPLCFWDDILDLLGLRRKSRSFPLATGRYFHDLPDGQRLYFEIRLIEDSRYPVPPGLRRQFANKKRKERVRPIKRY